MVGKPNIVTNKERVLSFLLGAAVVFAVGQRSAIIDLSRHNAMLAADYQDALTSDNRTTRSRTNFEFPRMGAVEMKAITEVATALSWPWELHAAIEKTENGGMHLEVGAQAIPMDIKRNFPPNLWQRATAVRIMQEEAGKMIIEDPDVTYVFAARLARRWKAADQDKWRESFITSLNKWRGEGEAVRPGPRSKPTKAVRRKKR